MCSCKKNNFNKSKITINTIKTTRSETITIIKYIILFEGNKIIRVVKALSNFQNY